MVFPERTRPGEHPLVQCDRRSVRREPRSALLGGADGLDLLRRLARDAPPLLEVGGLLAMEHGEGQSEAVARLYADAGLVEITRRKDLAGIERVVTGRRA